MNKIELQKIIKRIQTHYTDFIVNDSVIEEWYSMLKEYDYHDIDERLNKHILSEMYGDKPPKINYLLAGLIKSENKNLVNDYLTECPRCGKEIKCSMLEKHHSKCSAIEYIQKKYRMLYSKEIRRENLENLSDDEFEKNYVWILNRIYENTQNKWEQKILENILYGANYTMNEIVEEFN